MTRKRLTPQARREVIERAATEVFAERGYHGASVEEIARRSGISVPVLYDHFPGKLELHRHLLQRHFADLRAIWHRHLPGEGPADQRVSRTIDDWLGYIEQHPYAWRMLFRDTTGQDEIEDLRRQVAAESRALILPMFAREYDADGVELELAWEAWRAAIQGLALWWYDHRDVPRHQVVAAAMNALWLGLDRLRQGESWPG
ncbi:TetR/AcrR family transcriptional regulator [Nonomuraea sp. NEAU-A123]|uniref:TetR/AcrR family transcriptional regulator n=1 Tax=Nonomuraea sp. NEAU-A123 TaxID=2839649 RepID=UPI001BE4DFC9|nr:TetR/AcrR family transcriptional regulator [Nonomuraea sp. NEAU-A123]MBT2224750.1 TetR/AcrR family transcriptional regulator [Nonomuraea sp. NEAU-A123]